MMKRIPSEVWMSLGDLQPSRPLGEAAIEGGGMGSSEEPQIIILISD